MPIIYRSPKAADPTEFADPKVGDLAAKLNECVNQILTALPFASAYGIEPNAFKESMHKELLKNQDLVPTLYEKCRAILAKPLVGNGAENVIEVVAATFDVIYQNEGTMRALMVGMTNPITHRRMGGMLPRELYKPHVNARLPAALALARQSLGESAPAKPKMAKVNAGG